MEVVNKFLQALNKLFYMYSWDYITLAILIFVISLGFVLLKRLMWRKDKAFQIITLVVFFIYIAMVIYSTVLNRDIDSAGFKVKLIPFRSYFMIHDGFTDKVREVIMNVALFYPIGFLYCVLDTKKINSGKWPIVAMSAALSLLIELIQLVFKLGCVETDDIIHNVIGCCLGILGYMVLDFVTFNDRDWDLF